MRVFISHSAGDKPFVHRLKQAFAGAGIEAWNADDIAPGADWTNEVKHAIESADVVLPVISAKTEKSHFAKLELSFALAERFAGGRKRIIPVLADRKAEVPFFVKNLNWIDLSSEDLFRENIGRLVSALQHPTLDSSMDDILESHRERIQAEQMLLKTEKAALTTRALQRTTFVLATLAMAFVGSLAGLMSVASFITVRAPSSEWLRIIEFAATFVLGALSAAVAFKTLRATREKRLARGHDE